MAHESAHDAICRYLQDAIAAEEHFERQLKMMADEANETEVKTVFSEHAIETKSQHDRLKARLEELGGSTSPWKSFMASMFGTMPKTAQAGHHRSEKTAQDLTMAYAVEASEVAMYEMLATAAKAVGDTETATLARQIQEEERMAGKKVFDLIAPCARAAFEDVTEPARAAA